MKSNKYTDAFNEQGNLLTLTSIVAASAVMLSPLPLLVGAVAETAYLLFVPDSAWYQSRLRERKEIAIKARRDTLRSQVFDVVDRQTWARYEHLETIRNQIGAQTKKEEKWYGAVTSKLDYLLEKFLTFAVKEVEYRTYLTDLWREDTLETHEAVLSKSKK